MVQVSNKAHVRYEGKPGRLTEKIEKNAVARAKSIHQQDTEARYRPLIDPETGQQAKDSQGNLIEAIHGPLTKKNVPVGRHFDIQGRGRELRNMRSDTETNNRFLNEAALGRAAAGESTDFVVGGMHQAAQNLAYMQPNNPTAGTTYIRGPGATGGPPPAGLRGSPYLGQGRPATATSPATGPAERRTYPMEFAQRANNWQAASEDARGLAKPIAKVGAFAERQGKKRDDKAWAKDEARGFVRPIIGYRVAGGNVNFSNQFGPMGHGPASSPNPPAPNPTPYGPRLQPPGPGGPTTPAGPPKPTHNPFNPGQTPNQPQPQTPGNPIFQPPGSPQSPRPATNPFNPTQRSRTQRVVSTVEKVADIGARAAAAGKTAQRVTAAAGPEVSIPVSIAAGAKAGWDEAERQGLRKKK